MNFFTQLLETYKKGQLYDDLSLQYSSVQNVLESTKNSYTTCLEELGSVNKKYDLLSENYKKLLNKGKLNLVDLKEWYENKYGDTPYLHNFRGEGKEDIKLSLSWTPNGTPLLQQEAQKIIDKYALQSNSLPSSIVESVIKYFLPKNMWTYETDTSKFSKNEFWQLAEKSLVDKSGDCDDLAILMHVLILFIFKNLGVHDLYSWRLKLTIGNMLGVGGHAFNIWLHDDGEWYAIESTYDLKGSFNRTWLKTPIKNNNLYEQFWGYTRKDRSWKQNITALNNYEGD